MKIITLPKTPDFEAWRQQARICLAANLPPSAVSWGGAGNDLFAEDTFATLPAAPGAINVPKDFVDQARQAICHADPETAGLLYRILWRLSRDNRRLLQFTTDNDVIELTRRVKAVRRDAYKIKAFLRFREIPGTENQFVAWYEPEHFILDLALPFFTTRFTNMYWSILTPYKGAHWDTETLTFTDAPDKSQYPTDDKVEDHWLTYYATTYNPARTSKKAMMAQMPKKYWKNMPETALVAPLMQAAHARVQKMIDTGKAK